MGKRRKRNDRSVNHGEVEYFYPIDKSRQNSRALEPRNQTNKPTYVSHYNAFLPSYSSLQICKSNLNDFCTFRSVASSEEFSN